MFCKECNAFTTLNKENTIMPWLRKELLCRECNMKFINKVIFGVVWSSQHWEVIVQKTETRSESCDCFLYRNTNRSQTISVTFKPLSRYFSWYNKTTYLLLAKLFIRCKDGNLLVAINFSQLFQRSCISCFLKKNFKIIKIFFAQHCTVYFASVIMCVFTLL